MFQAIKNYLDNTKDKVVNKSDVVTAADSMFSGIQKEVIPSLKAALDSEMFLTATRADIFSRIAGASGIRATTPEDTIKGLISFFKNISNEHSAFISVINNRMNDKMFLHLATVQEVAILKTLTDLSAAELYIIDLLYFTVIDADTEYPKQKLRSLEEGIGSFSSIIKAYNHNFSKHVKGLDKVANMIVDTKASTGMMDKLLSKRGATVTMPLVSGFINNPIYHVRVWFADRQVAKYDSLKEKKKLLELRILDLKLQSEGTHNEKLKKQIAYYEDKISEIEYDIKDIEDDLT